MNKKSINKKTIIIFSTIIVLILVLLIFLIFNYKNIKNGNTIINKSEEQIVEDILKSKLYKATIEVEIETNKNKNKYKIEQELNENESIQEVVEPENIAGVKTKYDGKNLELTNPQLELNTIYENYSYIVDNNLWLDSFINQYKASTEKNISSNENEIILEIKKIDGNKYSVYKKLYIDKKTGKPTKLMIQDINQNTIIYIVYTKIEIS